MSKAPFNKENLKNDIIFKLTEALPMLDYKDIKTMSKTIKDEVDNQLRILAKGDHPHICTAHELVLTVIKHTSSLLEQEEAQPEADIMGVDNMPH